ncbi:MAG: 16S rRNA (guanine(966)-N(2))-methyltransferase RsmD [Holosporaceae bacterium]|nr:MAG: 16S rRNA (guanine(966)-N(2))-methyltransferase RsmD [Holosporaceae bacterium]
MRIIGGTYRGKKLFTPQDAQTRPTSDRVREAIFNVLESSMPVPFSEMSVLDLFSGTGALGIEALSRKAKSVLFVENHPEALHVLEKNTAQFKGVEILKKDATTFLLPQKKCFDLVFMDPPYGKDLIPKALNHLYEKEYIHPHTWVVCELGKKEEVPIPNEYHLSKKKVYGKTQVLFISLNKDIS